MAQEWRGLSNHQQAFAANKARASAAAEEITKEFVTSVTGAAIAEREAAEEEAEQAGEFDMVGAASKLLRGNRRKAKEDEAEREERREARRSQAGPGLGKGGAGTFPSSLGHGVEQVRGADGGTQL